MQLGQYRINSYWLLNSIISIQFPENLRYVYFISFDTISYSSIKLIINFCIDYTILIILSSSISIQFIFSFKVQIKNPAYCTPHHIHSISDKQGK